MTREPDTLLNTEQAARLLGVSASFLAKARVTGLPPIPYTRIGVAVRYRRADLDAYVEANMSHSTSEGNAA